jgi:hypothetical protein
VEAMVDPIIEPITALPRSDGPCHQLNGVGITPVDVIPVPIDASSSLRGDDD